MKHLLFTLVAALFACVSVFAQADKYPTEKAGLQKLDEKNGFREAKLGAPLSDFTDLQQVDKKGNSVFYTNPNDSKTIGDAELEEIQYRFYRGRLASIIFKTKGSNNSAKVKNTLELQYGKPQQANRYIPNYTWTGQKVLMKMDQNGSTKDAVFSINSKSLMEEEGKEKEEAKEKAKGDL